MMGYVTVINFAIKHKKLLSYLTLVVTIVFFYYLSESRGKKIEEQKKEIVHIKAMNTFDNSIRDIEREFDVEIKKIDKERDDEINTSVGVHTITL